MIRKMINEDLDKVVDIWLNVNIVTHHYIDAAYWKNNLNNVKQLMSKAEVYVYEEKEILGFIGLDGNYISGIFVSEDNQSRGAGKKLLDYVKQFKKELVLNVYQKNKRATNFYKREGFFIIAEDMDNNTNEKEYAMMWRYRHPLSME
jgi:putative acetyltransferase